MDKILTMILFSVLRKEAGTVTSRDPLEIKVEENLPEDLREYETAFLLAFRADKTKRRKLLQDMMVTLVKGAGEKMKGFSRKETVDYYKDIMETAWHSSRVLLLVDGNSNIDALIQGSRTQGILQGYRSTGCRMKYVPKTEQVKAGDIVLSSGLGGTFPKGLILGVVAKVDRGDGGLFQRIDVTPAVDLRDIEEVVVLSPEERPQP